VAHHLQYHPAGFFKECAVELTTWLPAMFALGLAGLGLMFAFVYACDRV
jgi:hypothetical protein